jgi:hypothetical protein
MPCRADLTATALAYFRSTAKAIDEYIEQRAKPEGTEIDARLVAIVERMFQRCFADNQFQQVGPVRHCQHRATSSSTF